MKIAIIGAGFTGLSAATRLLEGGHSVTLFEKDAQPGGLAIGYKEKEWQWTLEKHYHHWFTNDDHILNLAKEISYPVIIKRPKTSVYLDRKSYQLDSPIAFLKFPKLPLLDRLRMIAALAFLRFMPWWKPLEKINANAFLTYVMGIRAYGLVWEPQLRNKMGNYADDVSLVWFWSRIKKRTPSLGYPEKGFLPFAQAVVKAIDKKGGRVLFNQEISSIESKEKVSIHLGTGKIEEFDTAIVTLPSFAFIKLAHSLPEKYQQSLLTLKGLAATNLVLRLKNQFLTDGTYWLSICEKNSPIMVIVEHTNFMDKKYYNNEHLVYIGNYMPADADTFHMNKEELLKRYSPLLEKIHPGFGKDIISTELFHAPFAQPIVPANYSKMIPPFETPLKNVYLANMQQVYPWDRGTNYAVELGEKIAKIVIEHYH